MLSKLSLPLISIKSEKSRLFTTLRQTPLYQLHKSLNAKTSEFGGWEMPISYPDGIIKEHLHCRSQVGLFDVSHMLGVSISGKDRVSFAETIFPAEVADLPIGVGTLTNIPNDQGGIIDDCIITNMGDYLYLVINAGHEDKDLPHMDKYRQKFNGEVEITPHNGNGIIALQGPKSAEILSRLLISTAANDLVTNWKFMEMKNINLLGTDCLVARSGYTGEDGFEISCSGREVETLAYQLLSHPEVKPIGLGARDSLRLEAGLCLYGNDISDTTTPVEANLTWTIGKRRRREANFVGANFIIPQIEDKSLVKRKRIGWITDGAPIRAGTLLFNLDGTNVGVTTSGGFSPSLNKPIGMGYVKRGSTKSGTILQVKNRKGFFNQIRVTKMPFLTSKTVNVN